MPGFLHTTITGNRRADAARFKRNPHDGNVQFNDLKFKDDIVYRVFELSCQLIAILKLFLEFYPGGISLIMTVAFCELVS
jgi:hypothetical protein